MSPLELSVYPNPLNPGTTISFKVSVSANMKVVIRDLAGHTLRVLHDGFLEKGSASLMWNGVDDNGRILPTGVYLVEVSSTRLQMCQKISLIK